MMIDMAPSYPEGTQDTENVRDRVHEQTKHGRNPMCDQWCAALMAASPSYFASVMLRIPDSKAPFIVAPHHLEWDELVTQHKHYSVMAARGLGKSSYFSYAVPLWRMACFPNQNNLIVGSTDDNAKLILQKIREEVEENEFLQFLLPRGQDRIWNAHNIKCPNGHQLHVRSMGSRIRGFHPNHTQGDDVLDDDAKTSATYRKQTIEYWHSVLGNMPGEHGTLSLVGTPLHRDDLIYGNLRNNPDYACRSYPALNDQGESIFPEIMSTAFLQTRRRAMGSLVFDAEMMCQPITDDTSLFPRSLFLGDTVQPSYAATFNMSKEVCDELGLTLFIGVDFAFSANSAADYFVIFVIGVDAEKNRWWVGMHRERGVPFNRQQALMKELGHHYRPQLMMLEANQAQQMAADEMMRTTDLPIRKFVTTAKGKTSFETGLFRLRMLAENKKWRIPRGDEKSRELTDIVFEEMSGFTWIDGKMKSLSRHDDTVMALWLADRAASKGEGFKMFFGPPKEEAAVVAEGLPAVVQAIQDGAAPQPRISPPQAPQGVVNQPPAQQTPQKSPRVAQSAQDILSRMRGF